MLAEVLVSLLPLQPLQQAASMGHHQVSHVLQQVLHHPHGTARLQQMAPRQHPLHHQQQQQQELGARRGLRPSSARCLVAWCHPQQLSRGRVASVASPGALLRVTLWEVVVMLLLQRASQAAPKQQQQAMT
jgi:hypothetical protein